MKSTKVIFSTAFLGGGIISLLQILKPPPFAVFSLFLSAWLFAFWSEGKKTNVKYRYLLLPTFSFAMGNILSVLAFCYLLQLDQAKNQFPITFCPSLRVSSYVAPMVLFFLGLIGMRYDENRENYGYNKKLLVLAFIILLVFYLLSLSEEIVALFAV
jgi:hypothetical protein